MLVSCKRCDDAPPSSAVDASAHSGGAIDAATVIAEPPDAASVMTVTDAGEPPPTAFADAGTSSDCRLLYGPVEQAFRGPAALSVIGSTLRLVTNDAGKARVYSVATPPVSPKGTPSTMPPRPSTFMGMRWPPCELAGRYAYCQAPGGAVVRSKLSAVEGDDASTEHKTVAKSRSGTRIAAASLGADHAVLAYLDERRTTEGNMLEAFAVLDEQQPVRLSEEGAGATQVRFLPRGERPVAVYLDTRTSMVPMHARPLRLNAGDLDLGPDAVIFVGGVPERGIEFAVSPVGPKGFAFVPMPRETIDFGMAAIPIEDPPKDDVGAIWSLYPNGLDPAPIAAAPSRDGSVWVARVRPREKMVGSQRIVELGRVDGEGKFSSLGEIALAKGVTDMAMVEDRYGAVWILYGDMRATWLERRACQAAPAK